MKTLVIHPQDKTTDFLKKIYSGYDWSIITEHRTTLKRKDFLKKLNEHDRIIMMGHGSPGGLFYSYIDRDIVHILREKECICIWCNADQFVEKHGLTGFYTGMFISEVGEARYFNIMADQAEIDYSNELFAELVNYNLDNSVKLHSVLKESYNGDDTHTGESKVIQFNNDRLYYRDEESLLNDSDLDDEIDPAGGYGLSSHI